MQARPSLVNLCILPRSVEVLNLLEKPLEPGRRNICICKLTYDTMTSKIDQNDACNAPKKGGALQAFLFKVKGLFSAELLVYCFVQLGKPFCNSRIGENAIGN